MPLEPIETVNLDSGTDSPRLAREQLKQLVDGYNTLIGAVSILFSNDPIVIPADAFGVLNYASAATTIKVMRYSVDETADWTISKVDSVGVTSSLGGGGISITSLSSDSSFVTVTASRAGYTSVVRRLFVSRNNSANIPSVPDPTPPPTPTGFAAVAGINVIQMSWNAPGYSQGRGNGQTNIYGKVWLTGQPEPIFSDVGVTIVDTADANAIYHSFATDPNVRWSFWLKFQSKDGFQSAVPAPSGTTGLVVTSGQDPEKLLEILNGQITSSELAASLNTRIDLIDGPSGMAGSVAARVLTETNNRIAALNAEVINRNAAIGVETSNRISALSALSAVKNRIFYSGTAPVSDGSYTLQANDIWFNTADTNKPYRYNGSAWVSIADPRLSQVVTDLSTEITNRVTGDTAEINVRESLYAALNAGTGNDYKVFNQLAQPTGTTIGDVWTWKTGAGVETFKRWNGTTWVDSLANKAAATYRGAFTTAGLPASGNIIGDLARRTDDNAVVVWNGTAWVVKTATLSPVSAFVEQEKSARITADTANATSVTTLATQVTGGYTGTDVNALSSGIVYSERQARSTAITSEAYARDSLRAALGGSVGTDYRVFNQEAQPTATQIGDLWTWKTGAGVETFKRWSGTTWVDSLANQRPAVYLGVFASMPVVGNVIGDTARLTPPTNTVHVWNGAAWVAKTTTSGPSWAFVEQEKDARVTQDTAIAQSVTTLATQVTGGYSGTDPNALTSGIIYQERVARSTADTAQVNARDSLAAGVSAGTGTDYKVFNQLATPTATQIGDLWTWKTGAGVETFSRWSGTAWIDSVSNKRAAVYRGSYANFASLPPTGNVIGDSSLRSDTQEVYVWNGTAWVIKTASVSSAQAFIEQEKSLRSTQDSAEANARNTLAVQIRGGYTGTDLNLVSAGLIFDEKSARVSADNAAISRIQALELGSQVSRSTLTEVWDGSDPLSKWETLTGAAELAVVQAVDGQSGKILRIGNNSGNDTRWIAHRDLIPLTTDQLYKFTVKVRTTLGAGTFYAGFVGVGVDGVSYVNASNGVGYSPSYSGVANVLVPATETTYSAYFRRGSGSVRTGTGTKDNPYLTTSNVRYVRPFVSGNNSGVAGVTEVTAVLVDAITVDVQVLDSTVTNLSLTVNNGTTGVTATASRVTSLETAVNFPSTLNNATYAALISNYSTTAQMNSAIASSTSTVNARLNSGGDVFNSIVVVDTKATAKSANFVQSIAPTSTGSYTLKINDTWVDTANGRMLKVWNGTAWVAGDDTRIGNTASQVTTLQSAINTASQFDSYIAWEFQNSIEGWQLFGATHTLNDDYLSIQSTSTDPIFQKTGLSFPGGRFDKVRARVRRTAGSTWDGALYFTTSGHGSSISFYKRLTVTIPIGVWTVLEWDLESLTAGGNDWITNTILAIRLDLGNTATDAFDIDWVAVGKRGVGAGYATVQQEISTRASETGYFATQYVVRQQITSGGRTIMAGFGLMGTSSGTAGPTFDFGVQADKFWIGAPSSDSGIPDARPFIVQTSDTVDAGTGQLIPKGVYMSSAYIVDLTALWGRFGTLVANSIQTTSLSASQLTLGTGIIGGNLRSSNFVQGVSGWIIRPDGTAQFPATHILGQITASQINGTGLTIRDVNGNIIVNAGTGLIPNANISGLGALATLNDTGGGSNLVGLTAFSVASSSAPSGWVGYSSGTATPTYVTFSSGGYLNRGYCRVSSSTSANGALGISTSTSVLAGKSGVYAWTAGKTYTISFYARANTAAAVGKKLSSFAGSMGWATYTILENPVLVLNTWLRYSARVTPALNGFTANGELYISRDTTDAAWSAGASYDVSSIKVEEGSTATGWTTSELDGLLTDLSNAPTTILNSTIGIDPTLGTLTGIGTGSGRSVANNEDSVIRAPGGGVFVTTSPTVTGALKIRLPVFFTNTMIKFTVEIFEYTLGYSCTLEISGFNDVGSTGWYAVTARVHGASNVEYPVRFGHDGVKSCVWVGNDTETWAFPQVRLKDVFLGYNSYARSTWESGWQLSFDTTIPVGNVTAVVTDTLPGANWTKSSARPANLASLTGSEPILNSTISINTNGTLSGAGGGQVTLPGMGQSAYRVVSSGNSSTTTPTSAGVYTNGVQTAVTGRSYRLVVITRTTGVVIHSENYDVFNNSAQATALANGLNSLSSAYIVVVTTFDEPQTNRLLGGLDTAMYRCGASRAVFGSPNFKYRSAYVLIGIPGCGEGNGAEGYQGSVDSDTNAWVDMSFTLLNGSLTGVSTSYSPRTLQDFSYTGDLNATYGAPAGSPVAGNFPGGSSAASVETTASNASIAAAAAQVSANAANSVLADMASDNLLSPIEKPSLIQSYSVIVSEQAGIDAQATAHGVTTEKTTYDNAVSNLSSYLSTLTSPVAWDNGSGNTTIVGTTFRSNFATVYTTKQALLNKIAEVTRLAAAAAQTTADGAAITAAAAQAGLAAKLNKAGDTITGRINLSVVDGLFAGTDVNNGVYLGSLGLVGKAGGNTKFAIGTDGNAAFGGTLTANDMVLTNHLAPEAATLMRVASSLTAATLGTAAFPYNGSTQLYNALSITYTTNGYGSRRIELVGWSGTVTISHVSGPSSNPAVNWVLIRDIAGSLSTIISFGQVTTNGANLPNPFLGTIFDTDVITPAGTPLSVTYRLMMQAAYDGVGTLQVSLPVLAFASQRYMSIIEFKKAT